MTKTKQAKQPARISTIRIFSLKKMVLIISIVLLFTFLSGCIGDEGDDGTESDVKEPGSYLIEEANKRFGQDPKSEEKVNKWLDEVIEETSGAPAYPVESLPYTENSLVDPSGIITPAPTPEIKREYGNALDLDMLIINMMIHHQGGGDIVDEPTESFIKSMNDEKSLHYLQEFKEDNINIVYYGIPEAYASEDGSKYLTNVFETEDGQNGHIRLKLVNKGNKENPNWIPDRIVDYQLYPDNIPLSLEPSDFIKIQHDGSYDCSILKKSTEHWGWTQMFPEEDDYYLDVNKPDICMGVISADGGDTLHVFTVKNQAFMDYSDYKIGFFGTSRTENLDDLEDITPDNLNWNTVFDLIERHNSFPPNMPTCEGLYGDIREIRPRRDSYARGTPDMSVITGVRKVKETE